MWVLGVWDGGRRGGEEERWIVGGGPSGTRGSEEVWRVFPLPTQAPGRLLGAQAGSFAFWGPLQLHWSWGGVEKRRGGWRGALWDQRIRGEHRLVEWVQKTRPIYMLSTRDPLQT